MRRVAAVLVLLAACGEEPPPVAPPPLPEVRPGESVTGSLVPGDSVVAGSFEDRWSLDLAPGQRVYLELRADSFDAHLRLRGPAGLMTAANNDALGRDAAIVFRAVAAGRHTVAVRAEDSVLAGGPYTLTVGELGDSVRGPGAVAVVAVGDSLTGVLETGDSLTPAHRAWGTAAGGTSSPQPVVRTSGIVDYYAFRPESAGVVAVELRSDQFDAYLAVGDSALWEAYHDDDDAGGTDARVRLRVEAGHTYRVAAAGYGADRAPGLYRLSIRRVPETRGLRVDSVTGAGVWPLTPVAPEVRICEGKPLGTAAAYDRAARQRHATNIVANGGAVDNRNEWGTDEPSRLELVLCMERSQMVLQVCHYMGPSITRYRNRWTARLVEARTARLLAREQVQGSAPRACGYSEPYNLTVLTGSHDAYSEALADMRPQLVRWVAHDSGAVALPTAPPRARPPVTRAGGSLTPDAKRPGSGVIK